MGPGIITRLVCQKAKTPNEGNKNTYVQKLYITKKQMSDYETDL